MSLIAAVPDFVAIDFETCNTNRASPIQIGLTRVVNGVPRAPQTSPIMPPPGNRTFDPSLTKIHGLTEADIHGAPEWDEIHQRLIDYVGDLPLVAHNASFERSVIVQSSQSFGFLPRAFDYHCTLSMARRLDPKRAGGPESHKLNVLAERYGIEQLAHHDAGDDALVGAHLALHLLAMPGGEDAFTRAKLK